MKKRSKKLLRLGAWLQPEGHGGSGSENKIANLSEGGAFEDPPELALAVPERFYSWSEFLPFLRSIVQAYATDHPGQEAHYNPLQALINEDAAAA